MLVRVTYFKHDLHVKAWNRMGLVTFLFLLCKLSALSQTAPVPIIHFCITDSVGKALPFCYITASALPGKIILWHQNAGDTNCISKTVAWEKWDSLQFSISHTGYVPAKIILDRRDAIGDTIYKLVALMPLPSTLPDAIVTAPPVWVRGDTTFYKVDAFKAGDERKLKDIITKLPGFEIDRNGRLLFQHKPVDRITIEGEEIFSDKLELMLNSFPVHVLDQVQAIENQSRNRLLKGLNNDQLVFVNLGLKKEKLKAAFGDGEVGLGTAGRYQFNPVLFGLSSKVKAGFIANYNSLGTGFDWKYEGELKVLPNRDAERWIMQGMGLHTINNVESRRYIRNQLFDNRLQVNVPISKKLFSVTEFNWVKDRQQQETALESALLNGDVFVTRTDSNRIVNKPSIHNHNFKLEWRMDSARNLIAGINYYGNFQQSSQQGIYIFQDGKRDSTAENISQQLQGMGMLVDYTHRIRSNKAYFVKGYYNWQHFPQTGNGFSNAYPSIFNLPLSYAFLSQQTALKRQVGGFEYKTMVRPRKTLFTNQVEMNWEKSTPQNEMRFKDSSGQGNGQVYSALSNTGTFEMYRFTAGTSTSFSWGEIPMSVKGKLGWQSNSEYNLEKNKKASNGMVLQGEVTGSKKFSKGKMTSLVLRHEQMPVSLFQIVPYNMPVQLVQFRRYAASDIDKIASTAITSYRMQHGRNNSSLSIFYTRNWNGEAFYNEFFQFAQSIVDSFNRRSYNSIMVNYNGNFSWPKAGINLNVASGYNRYDRQYVNKQDIANGRYDMYYINTTLNKQWQKRLFIEWRSHYNADYNKLPSSFGSAVSPWVTNFNTHLRPRYVIKPWMSVTMIADYYLNNIFTNNQASFFLMDAELSLQIPKKSYSFRLRLDNITNQPYFYHVNQSALSQSFFTVPLVARNLIVFFRYEL